MNSSIDLVWFSKGVNAPIWSVGPVHSLPPATSAVVKAIGDLSRNSNSEAMLFWDASLGTPDSVLIQELVASPVDCWHAGLKLGTGGFPGILDFVSPTWMLACDPPADIEATSWRLSFRACLVRTEVLRKLGGPRPEFQTLEAAALEMGHRWIRRGALMRHTPGLVDHGTTGPRECETGLPKSRGQKSAIPFADELRFAYYRFGRKWAAWALFRALMTRYINLPTALRSWRQVMSTPRPPEPSPLRAVEVQGSGFKVQDSKFISAGVVGDPPPFRSPAIRVPESQCPSVPVSISPGPFHPCSSRVSVLIPTLDRYPYLRVLLDQLRRQTVKPQEIIIVDQTARERRQEKLRDEFGDLPLKVIFQDEPGQCTSRNAGLQVSRGDNILFIDDDDEVRPDLIEKHLRTLHEFEAEVSSGVADEIGAGPLPHDFCFLRASDVFPTNNTMIRRDVLLRSGLFDLAYNRRQRADGDLGMRIYLCGASMVLNPAISVLHHHAPSGGLRKHKARTITYAMSRTNLSSRAVVSASEIYLSDRYFPGTHARETLWQNILGTFSIRGGTVKRLAKIIVSVIFLPQSVLRVRRRFREAREMARSFPQIPQLERSPGETPRVEVVPSRPMVPASLFP